MLRYDGEVAIVTGGGRGIGAEHAKMLAARGCRVVVNDLGAGPGGESAEDSPADAVVNAIRNAGGEATADASDIVTDATAVAERAIEEYGRVDLLISNAGILRRNAFAAVPEDELRATLDVHVVGAFRVAQQVWPHLQESGNGRVLFTSSANVWGAPGSIAYATAKAAMIGLVNTLAIEGAENGIRVNGILPTARTRMNDSIGEVVTPAMQKLLTDHFDPAHIAAFAVWLLHRENAWTGELFSVGGGRAARVVLGDTRGAVVDRADSDAWTDQADRLRGLDGFRVPASAGDSVFQRLTEMGISVS